MINELLTTFDTTVKLVHESVADLPEEKMVSQPSGIPNHAAWTLGHLSYSCQLIASELGVEGWLPDDWADRFGTGTSPISDAAFYPIKADLVRQFTNSTGRIRKTILSQDESALAQPLPDQRYRDTLPTIGHAVLQILAGHTAFHAGQLSVWRRALGFPPITGLM